MGRHSKTARKAYIKRLKKRKKEEKKVQETSEIEHEEDNVSEEAIRNPQPTASPPRIADTTSPRNSRTEDYLSDPLYLGFMKYSRYTKKLRLLETRWSFVQKVKNN